MERNRAVVITYHHYTPSLPKGHAWRQQGKSSLKIIEKVPRRRRWYLAISSSEATDPTEHGPSYFLPTMEVFQSTYKQLPPSGATPIYSELTRFLVIGVSLCFCTAHKVQIQKKENGYRRQHTTACCALARCLIPLLFSTKEPPAPSSRRELDGTFNKYMRQNLCTDARAFHSFSVRTKYARYRTP